MAAFVWRRYSAYLKTNKTKKLSGGGSKDQNKTNMGGTWKHIQLLVCNYKSVQIQSTHDHSNSWTCDECIWQHTEFTQRMLMAKYWRKKLKLPKKTISTHHNLFLMNTSNRSCSISDSPAGQVSSTISLQKDGCLADLLVSDSLQPTSDSLLDFDTGWAKFIRPELLQVRYLSSPEEDLCLTKLEHVGILRDNKKGDQDSHLSSD